MKLEKFDYQIGNRRKVNSFAALFVCVLVLFIGVIIYRSFAIYKVTNTYNIIKGSVATFTVPSKQIYYYLVAEDDTSMTTNSVPNQNEYTYDADASSCDSGTPVVYDSLTNTISVTSANDEVCHVYFNIIPLSRRTMNTLGVTTIKEGTPTYTAYNASEDGYYSALDDYGTSYYYYGTTRKYFMFNDILYYIIRINGDGSIRLLATEPGVATPFNTTINDNSYLGLYYGTANSNTYDLTHSNTTPAPIITSMNTYYTSLSSTANITDTLFCNDRSLYNELYQPLETGDTSHGYGSDKTFYGSYYRLRNNTPSLQCPNINDAFTVDDEVKGNGKLTNPIGGITADELYMTGLINITSLNVSSISPWKFDTSAFMYGKVASASATGIEINNSSYVYSPVINVRGDLPITGSGTDIDPYTYTG